MIRKKNAALFLTHEMILKIANPSTQGTDPLIRHIIHAAARSVRLQNDSKLLAPPAGRAAIITMYGIEL